MVHLALADNALSKGCGLSELLFRVGITAVAESAQEHHAALPAPHEPHKHKSLSIFGTHLPFWVREAATRAHSLLQIFLTMESQSWADLKPSIGMQLDKVLARCLVQLYRAMDCTDENWPISAQHAIIGVAINLVDLFAPTIGDLQIEADVMKLALSADKRRALVWAANEMVTDLIQHSFLRQSSGHIFVGLAPTGQSSISLRVESDGTKIDYRHSSYSLETIDGLAQLLDGKLILRESRLGGTSIELAFPAPS